MLQPGLLLAGRYRIQQQVGTGGMGNVYAARDERLGRDVAIKLLRPDLAARPEERQRFLNEGRIAAQVVDPHIVRTYDAGDSPEGPFLVQELLQGRPLDQALPLAVDPALDVAGGIAAALTALHERGYVHCDVKPQNIWLRPNGEAVLLDFGIARAEGTQTTTLIATPQYLAPERIDGHAPAAASDLYALGTVLYQLLTGRLPFDGPDMQAILAAQRNAPVPPLGIAEPKAALLDSIIARLMAKAPADRYPSAAMLAHDLQAVRAVDGAAIAAHDQTTTVVGSPKPPTGPGMIAPPPAAVIAPVASPPIPQRQRLLWPLVVLALVLLFGLALALSRHARATQNSGPGAQEQVAPSAAADATARTITVPDLTNQTADSASATAQAVGLQVQVVAQQPNAAPANMVLSQEPGSGTQVGLDQPVGLTVSSGPADEGSAPVALPPQPVRPQRHLPAKRPGKGKGKD